MKSKSSKDEEKIETVKEEEPTVSTPEEEIQKLKSEVEDYNEKFLRVVADFDNFRKRIDRDREQQSLRLRGEILSNFLEIVDTVEKAVEAVEERLDEIQIEESRADIDLSMFYHKDTESEIISLRA